ncbi:hypothetical protein [Burkholderia thailandensis]|uniref:hypothetical protein n=1 Tax=Burkholderia thailandensis TaxID=57975 RepID=UPI000492B598|nr:hypothetical protein [Burkholderia thailandensis]AJT48796.1 hypothetical protein DR62_06945 [Burkholderia thailandensis]AOI51222.1 hypothetical protein WI24_04990 [Burkholderia thailandensis]
MKICMRTMGLLSAFSGGWVERLAHVRLVHVLQFLPAREPIIRGLRFAYQRIGELVKGSQLGRFLRDSHKYSYVFMKHILPATAEVKKRTKH